MEASRAATQDPFGSSLPEQLLAIHSAPDVDWLADAASTAAERGLGALYSLVYLLDTAGQLKGQPLASTAQARSLRKLQDALGVDLTKLSFDPQEHQQLEVPILNGRPVVVDDLSSILPLGGAASAIHEVQSSLGVGSIIITPIYEESESLGVMLLLMPAGTEAQLADAKLLGRHVAVALGNLRAKAEGRRRGSLDVVRWVSDELRFREQLERETNRSRRHGRALSILLLRVENLQALRQQYGRFLADQLLRQLAGEMDDATRDTDFLGASGDSGLAAILVETDEEGAAVAERRLLEGVSTIKLRHTDLPGLVFQFTCATATVSRDGDTSEALMAAAEARMASPEQRAARTG